MRDPDILVYAGRGSSHSWTWLADLFESEKILNVRFLDSRGFMTFLDEESPGKVIISGGDGFTIAEALKGKGFSLIESHIDAGGSYVGICAGAYLPLPSSIPPFSEFNLSSTKIENVRCDTSLTSHGPRVAVTYGSCAIVHPIRGPMELGKRPGASVIAPLYGGPIFKEPTSDQVIMRYDALTPETEVQVGRSEAESMLIGRPSVIRAVHGKGDLLLFGPHLEHPRFPDANVRFLEILGLPRSGHPVNQPAESGLAAPGLLSAVSDLKVAVLGLENRSFTVGRKVWDGGRLLELLSAIEKRARTIAEDVSARSQANLRRARDLLIRMEAGSDSDADETTVLLVEAARVCVDSHFAMMREQNPR